MGKHDPARTAIRHGHEKGSATLGGLGSPRLRGEGIGPAAPGPCRRRVGRAAGAGLRTVLLDRDPRPDGDGQDAGRRLDASLRHGGAGTGRRPDRADGPVGEQVSGQPAFRHRDRDRAGRDARRPAGRAGPGRGDDRRDPLRRAPVRVRARDRHRRRQTQSPVEAWCRVTTGLRTHGRPSTSPPPRQHLLLPAPTGRYDDVPVFARPKVARDSRTATEQAFCALGPELAEINTLHAGGVPGADLGCGVSV